MHFGIGVCQKRTLYNEKVYERDGDRFLGGKRSPYFVGYAGRPPPCSGQFLFKKGGAGVSRFGDRRQIMKKIIEM